MSITLIVKRVEGMQLTRYVLDQRQPLILEAPPLELTLNYKTAQA